MQSDDLKEQVRQANDLASLVSEFTTLTKAGSRLKGLCPLPGHSEKTPSFTVSEDLQLYYCYGCKRGGDVFSFCNHMKSFDFKESLEFLANRAGITIDRRSSFDKTFSKLLELNKLTQQFFKKSLNDLKNDHPVKVYLEKRGILDMVSEFNLGYVKDSWTSLSDELKSEDIKLAEQLGLIKKNKSGNYYDFFRNRIIFSIEESRGVIGFGGRAISEDDQVKYLNSPESKLFHKSRVLYSLNKSVSAIRTQGMAILVEGYMDVISMHKHGFKNTVGVLGAALSDRQAGILRKYTKNVVLMFDSDEAGKIASKKALPVLLKAGLYPKILKLPFKDPDETLKNKGAQWFRDNLGQAEDLFKWLLLDNMKAQNRMLTIYDRERIFDEMRGLKKYVNDQILMHKFDQMFEEILEIPKHVVNNKGFRSQSHGSYSFSKIKPEKSYSSPKYELTLAAILLTKPEFSKKLDGVEDMLSCKKITHIVKKVQKLSGHDASDIDSLIGDLEPESGDLIECMMDLSTYDSPDSVNGLFGDCVSKIKARFLKYKSKLVLDGMNNDNRNEKLKQFSRIQIERHGS